MSLSGCLGFQKQWVRGFSGTVAERCLVSLLKSMMFSSLSWLTRNSRSERSGAAHSHTLRAVFNGESQFGTCTPSSQNSLSIRFICLSYVYPIGMTRHCECFSSNLDTNTGNQVGSPTSAKSQITSQQPNKRSTTIVMQLISQF